MRDVFVGVKHRIFIQTQGSKPQREERASMITYAANAEEKLARERGY